MLFIRIFGSRSKNVVTNISRPINLSDQFSSAISFLSEVRRRRACVIPFASSSAVATALIEEALDGHLQGKSMSIKSLFASTGYSTIGMRYQFDRLCERGFIRLRDNPTDRRMKLILVTEKSLQAYKEILDGLNS